MKRLHRGEKGFTLIELLIVIAILGIIAAVVIPNAAGFMTTGTLNAANTEAANVKTAATGYMAEHDGTWPLTSGDLGAYFEGGTGALKAKYTFGDPVSPYPINSATVNFSAIVDVDDTGIAKPWTGICWNILAQQWKRGTAGADIGVCPEPE